MELHTTQGLLAREDLGLILPHEHVFVDLGPMEEANWRDADPEAVVEVMAPEIERARDAGVTALVEATPEGVGRRVDIDLAVSEATDFPIVVPTGIYQEPSIPEWAREASEDELTEWLVEDLTEGVDDTGVRAAWIKVSTDDDDLTGLSTDEAKILRAAARAGERTGAAIGSHTLHGELVHEQLDVVEEVGYSPERFVWIHAQADDERYHREVAERGAYVEFDWIGGDDQDDGDYVDRVRRLVEAGYTDRVLLSQDRGWYDPSEPDGGEQKPYTHLTETFLLKLREAGVDEATVRRLTRDNPFEAYAR
ncbi:phosphotriesterase family protein [Halosimplex pelagicum]|uniref:Esterase n=1 Tax=Halosimplex pelagicum TaxID=869886 RepID=A0A7D5THB4_9EURY|nr:esterase [Halosimplex pelagicum]QLH82676.1 esterase [Halosimplex pelagicum]